MKVIKREVLIDAPPARVWEHITDPKKIAGWFMPTDFEARVGKEFSLLCEHETVSCVVKEIIPHQKLVYTFQSATTRVETLVTFTLVKEGTGTRVTIIHSGWDALPPADQDVSDQFDQGWRGFLQNLQGRLAATIK